MQLILDIRKLFIECNRDSCFERKIGGVNVYLYGYFIPLVPVCVVRLCLLTCLISNQSNSKKPRHLFSLSKLMPCCKKTHYNVLVVLSTRLSMCRSIMSLNKITYQMWYNHPFCKRNKTTKIVENGFVVWGGRGGRGGWVHWTKLKKEGYATWERIFIK